MLGIARVGSRLRFVFGTLLFSVVSLGCSGTPDSAGSQQGSGAVDTSADDDPTTDDAIDALVGASCTEADVRRVDVALTEGSCANVTTETGTWLARPLFADAPQEVRERSCRFTWRARRGGGTSSDFVALQEAVQGVLSPSCARGRPPTVGPAEDEDPADIGPMGGSIGCDVCGKNRDRKGWVVVPPNERVNKRLQLRLALASTSAEPGPTELEYAFEVPLPTNASALSVDFPAPPRGTRFVPDSLRVGR